jgi:hypothetical protein
MLTEHTPDKSNRHKRQNRVHTHMMVLKKGPSLSHSGKLQCKCYCKLKNKKPGETDIKQSNTMQKYKSDDYK